MRMRCPYLRLEMVNSDNWTYASFLGDERVTHVRRFEMKAGVVNSLRVQTVAALWKKLVRVNFVLFHAIQVDDPVSLLTELHEWKERSGSLWWDVRWYCRNADAFPIFRGLQNIQRLTILGVGAEEDARIYSLMKLSPVAWPAIHTMHIVAYRSSRPTRVVSVLATDLIPNLKAVFVEGPGEIEDLLDFLRAHLGICSLSFRRFEDHLPILPTLPKLKRLVLPLHMLDGMNVNEQPSLERLVLNMYPIDVVLDADDVWLVVFRYLQALEHILNSSASYPALKVIVLSTWPTAMMRSVRWDVDSRKCFEKCVEVSEMLDVKLEDHWGRVLELEDLRFRKIKVPFFYG